MEGVRWSLDPKNKDEAVGLLVERLKLPRMWRRSPMRSRRAAEGFDKDAQIDLEGFRNVLKLRATHLGTWGGNPPDPAKYHRSELLPEGAGGDVALRVP